MQAFLFSFMYACVHACMHVYFLYRSFHNGKSKGNHTELENEVCEIIVISLVII